MLQGKIVKVMFLCVAMAAGLLYDATQTCIMGPLDRPILSGKEIRVCQLHKGKYVIFLTLRDDRVFSGEVDHGGGHSTIRFKHYQPR